MHIAIVGGGIGGLTAALALARRGIDADVYEGAPAFQPVGAGIWVPPNGMCVLDRLGVGESVRHAGVQLERAELRDARSGLLQAVDMRLFADRFGAPNVAITRSALHAALVAAIDPRRLHLGRRCVRVSSAGSGAVIDWEDGEHREADLVIGADGLHAVTRRAVVPASALRYAGQSCHRGIADLSLPAPLRETAWEVWNGAVRFGFSAIGPNQVYWFAPFLAPAGEADNAAGLTDSLLRRYEDFPDPIPEVLRHTPSAAILRTDLYDLRPLPRWASPGVVLIGDAAHATTPNLGQGGAQAIEDAHVLAEVIAAHGATADACARYERRRRARALRIVRMSWRIGRVAHWRPRWACAIRNAALRAVPTRARDRFMQDLLTLPY